MLKSWGSWLAERADKRGLIAFISVLAVAGIYFWGIGTPALTHTEASSISSTPPLSAMVNHALNAPHDVFVSVLKHFHHATPTAVRSISAIFGLVFIYSFYLILKYWFGTFTAWLGTLLFASTPLLILMSRSASGDIMFLWPITVVAAYMKWVRSRSNIFARWMLLVCLTAITFYEPSGIWLMLLMAVYTRKSLLAYAKTLSKKQLGITVLSFLVLLIPLVLTVVHQGSIYKELLLLPAAWFSAVQMAKYVGWSFMSYFWHSNNYHELQVGRLAILNAAQIILLLFGVYALWDRARNKLYAMFSVLFLAILVAAVNGNYNLLILGLPSLALVITAGIRFLHLEWTSIFPRNPLPRGLAIILLITVVVINLAWGAHYALTAWVHAAGA